MIKPKRLNLNLSKKIAEVSSILEESHSWTIFTHRKVDGDAMGSVTALMGVGLLCGKKVTWAVADDDVPTAYTFLEHSKDFTPYKSPFVFDDPEELYVYLDCSDMERSFSEYKSNHCATDIKILNIDHHEDNTLFATVNCVDPSSSSTSEVVFDILKSGNWPFTKAIAESLYVGLYTDTGGFAFANTSPRTHRFTAELLGLGVDPSIIDDKLHQTSTPASMGLWGKAFLNVRLFGPENIFAISWLSRDDFKATGALDSDTEGLSSTLRQLRGVRLTVLLTETASGTVRASFRSRGGIFPASEVAHLLGGGGHPRAAGAVLAGSLAERLKDVPELMERHYAEWIASAQQA